MASVPICDDLYVFVLDFVRYRAYLGFTVVFHLEDDHIVVVHLARAADVDVEVVRKQGGNGHWEEIVTVFIQLDRVSVAGASGNHHVSVQIVEHRYDLVVSLIGRTDVQLSDLG